MNCYKESPEHIKYSPENIKQSSSLSSISVASSKHPLFNKIDSPYKTGVSGLHSRIEIEDIEEDIEEDTEEEDSINKMNYNNFNNFVVE
jgi:hypothetical protein